MTNDQMILIHKALTATGATNANAATLELALRLLGHRDIADKIDNAVGHCLWAADNLAAAKAARPADGTFEAMFATTPAEDEAARIKREYDDEWAALVASIKTVADGLAAQIPADVYAAHDERGFVA